jgi:hypothetical protein
MGVSETVAAMWERTTIPVRKTLLEKICGVTGEEEILRLSHTAYDDLGSVPCSNLIMAYTDDGFDIEEWERQMVSSSQHKLASLYREKDGDEVHIAWRDESLDHAAVVRCCTVEMLDKVNGHEFFKEVFALQSKGWKTVGVIGYYPVSQESVLLAYLVKLKAAA